MAKKIPSHRYIATRHVFVEKIPFGVIYYSNLKYGNIDNSGKTHYVQNHFKKKYYVIMIGEHKDFVLEKERYIRIKTNKI